MSRRPKIGMELVKLVGDLPCRPGDALGSPASVNPPSTAKAGLASQPCQDGSGTRRVSPEILRTVAASNPARTPRLPAGDP
jgi:hypothetical protein